MPAGARTLEPVTERRSKSVLRNGPSLKLPNINPKSLTPRESSSVSVSQMVKAQSRIGNNMWGIKGYKIPKSEKEMPKTQNNIIPNSKTPTYI